MTAAERIASSYRPYEIKSSAGKPLASLYSDVRIQELRSLILKHGAVLLRGFAVENIESFRDFVRIMSGKTFF